MNIRICGELLVGLGVMNFGNYIGEILEIFLE